MGLSPLSRDRRWQSPKDERSPLRTSRSLLVALVLTCAVLMTLDHATGSGSPLEPVRRAVGEVMGPVENVTAQAARPFTSIGDSFTSRDELRRQVRTLQSQNATLREQVATAGFDRNRLAEYEGLIRTAEKNGRALLPARVVGFGPAQSFSRTVTIDAGSSSGVRPDLTVVNNDGLVGRVLRVTRSTATVLLIIDDDSVLGGRVGDSMEVGFIKGRGRISGSGQLDFDLVDTEVTPAEGDTVVTWGDQGGASSGPYAAGIPVGRVTEVFSSLRDNSRRAVIEPFADFSSLDLVGVVVPSGTTGDRAVIEVDGSVAPAPDTRGSVQ